MSERPILSTWIDYCLELEDENRELRALATVLLFTLARTRDPLKFACSEIERRFPNEEAA